MRTATVRERIVLRPELLGLSKVVHFRASFTKTALCFIARLLSEAGLVDAKGLLHLAGSLAGGIALRKGQKDNLSLLVWLNGKKE